ncbi:MAG: protein translocase subunit SecD [Bauldia sp.]|nr:protein translocase subunit SecD [Bauldia sp.]
MLQFSRLAMVSIISVIVLATVVVIPNLFSKETVDGWPSWMPKQQIVLGLDLQGGVYLLYEIDREEYVTTKLQGLATDVRSVLAEAPRVNYESFSSRAAVTQSQAVQFRLTDATQLETARRRLEPLRNQLGTSILGGAAGNYEFDLTIGADGLVRFTYSAAGLEQRINEIAQQSIEVIDRRINALGTVEPSIQRQGVDRILVEAPGLEDPQRLQDLIGQTAEMTFHLVDRSTPTVAVGTIAPEGKIVVPDATQAGLAWLLDANALIRGDQITRAQATLDQTNGAWVVAFGLNTSGARIFGEVTSANVNYPFAIVLDDTVISAPTIQSAILGGSGQITGNFTAQTANDLAILLRAGALPAKLTVIEQRTVSASLGEDSIRAGAIATIVALVWIAGFMMICYGLLGAFSVLALIAQNIIMLGILSLLGATLTLPGIAGIVLTMAMAVDANVLIYERMREEARAGRPVVVALDQGFRRALATIVDSHLTALIAAIALFWLGSGPIRGFAVTLGIGILSTLFTAYLITRLIVAIWYRARRPKAIPL